MELFIPGLLLFFVSVVISFVVAPRFTPLVVALLSLGFLTYGVHNHYKMFAAEYRLSTWQESLKIYAPAIMIGAIILFIIYAILAFFTKGAVPIPNENTTTNSIVNSLNQLANTVNNNRNNNVINNVNNQINNANKNRNNVFGLNNNQNKKNGNNLSRSFLETI